MSIVIGKDAILREAVIASEQAQKSLEAAAHAKTDEAAASMALISFAASARELCCLARVALSHWMEKPR